MRKMIALFNYQIRIYCKSSRYVMPLIVTFLFLYFLYSEKVGHIEGCLAMTCYFVFCIAAWIGFTFSACEDTVMEQIQFLRVKGSPVYFVAKAAVLAAIGLTAAGLCVVIPFFQWLSNGAMLYGKTVTGHDIFGVVLVAAACAFSGGALGSLLHPGVMRDRKSATLLTTLFVLVSILRRAVTGEIPQLRFCLWILPPVDRAVDIYSGGENPGPAQTCGVILTLVLYGIMYNVIKSVICYKRKA